MNRRRSRGNRIGLFVCGLILLAAGLAVLARGLGRWRHQLGRKHAPVITASLHHDAAANWWFWVAVAAVAVVIALLALRWLAVQGVTGAVRVISLEPDRKHGVTTMPARAATSALEDDLAASPDLRRAHALLTGSPRRPRLSVSVTLTAEADPAAARQRIEAALSRLRQSLEMPDLNATVRIRIAPVSR